MILQYNPAKNAGVRLAIYVFLILMFVVVVFLLSKNNADAVYAENGFIEYAQLSFLLTAILTVLVGTRRINNFRELFHALIILFSLASIRESDALLDKFIPVMGWKLPAICVAVYGLLFGLKNRRQLKSQMSVFLSHRSFFLFCAAFVVILLSQFLGWGAFLKPLLSDNYSRTIKKLIEENCELVGYIVLLFGSREYVLKTKNIELIQKNKLRLVRSFKLQPAG